MCFKIQNKTVLQRVEELKPDPALSKRGLHRPLDTVWHGAHWDTSTRLAEQSTPKFKVQWSQLKDGNNFSKKKKIKQMLQPNTQKVNRIQNNWAVILIMQSSWHVND